MEEGRPTKLTQETTEKICNYLRLGNTRRVAALCGGISEKTLYNWIAQAKQEEADGNEEGEFLQFFQSLMRAEAECQARNVAVVEKSAFGHKTQSTRTKTKRYKEQILGTDGKPMRGKDGKPLMRQMEETETVVVEGSEFAYQAALELLKRRFRSEWGDSLDLRKVDDETLLRLLEPPVSNDNPSNKP